MTNAGTVEGSVASGPLVNSSVLAFCITVALAIPSILSFGHNSQVASSVVCNILIDMVNDCSSWQVSHDISVSSKHHPSRLDVKISFVDAQLLAFKTDVIIKSESMHSMSAKYAEFHFAGFLATEAMLKE